MFAILKGNFKFQRTLLSFESGSSKGWGAALLSLEMDDSSKLCRHGCTKTLDCDPRKGIALCSQHDAT
jgi:hypothetical protein